MKAPAETAKRFGALDIHDDTVEGIRFVPAVKRGSKARLEVTLLRHWKNALRVLRFHDCVNFRMDVDTGVLLGNAPNNAAGTSATADVADITALMRQQRRSWNVSYQKSIDPLPDKIASAHSYVLFGVDLFGGKLFVVARSFTLRKAARSREEAHEV
jgi:hypothetical protein